MSIRTVRMIYIQCDHHLRYSNGPVCDARLGPFSEVSDLTDSQFRQAGWDSEPYGRTPDGREIHMMRLGGSRLHYCPIHSLGHIMATMPGPGWDR
jgi:hypothetical protein